MTTALATIEYNNVEHAIALAVLAHRGQTDKQGKPYILHPFRVAADVEKASKDPDYFVAAMLHDVIEDTPVTLGQLADAGFSPRAIEAVDALTKRKGENYITFVRRAGQNEIARMVKLSDIKDNLNRIPKKFEGHWWNKIQEKYIVGQAILTNDTAWLAENAELVKRLESK
jgi:guanosine-3',5'-bis(diphosphate) 3'-pyrophosphohydrolase